MLKKLNLLVGVLLLAASCTSIKEVAYLQDVQQMSVKEIETKDVKITVDDLLSIAVSCSNPDLAIPFNLPMISYQLGTTVGGGQQRILGYLVNADGTIDFPILGTLQVKGLTRKALTELIKTKLMEGGYIKDPVVTIQFQNFKISVMGEVTRPGSFTINSDRITIFEALSMAGDLTIYGCRDKVMVIREENGKRLMVCNDLRSKEIFNSPTYYLQQNDVVYVEPNKIKAGQRNINQNNSVGVWVSIASFLTTVAVLIFK